MALEEDHNVYNPEELDEEEEDDDESGNFNHASLIPANDININVNADGDVDVIHPADNDAVVDDEDDDVDVDEDEDVDDSTSSSNVALALAGGVDPSSFLSRLHHDRQNRFSPAPVVASAAVATAAGSEVTVALPSDHHSIPELNHPLVDEVVVAAVAAEGKKPMPIDESRKLFQRLWTDEDEIELLQGFLDYTTSRGLTNSSHHHHDTTAFYDQIKCKLQLDFNKNQLVEKLRRLKKKYRTVLTKMGSGKEYVFKSPHDQATYEISRKIWGENGAGVVGGGGSAVASGRVGVVLEEGGFDDDETNHNFSINFLDQSPNLNFTPNHNHNHNPNGVDILEKKIPRSRKRSRVGAVKVEEKQFGFKTVPVVLHSNQQQHVGLVMPTATPIAPTVAAVSGVGSVSGSGQGMVPIPNANPTPSPAPALSPAPVAPAPAHTPMPATSLIEETVRSCLSPIFKELLNTVMSSNGPIMGSSRGFGFALSPMPLGLNGDMVTDEKWRKQQILELEVYSKRLELVQDQIKAQLEELRSLGG